MSIIVERMDHVAIDITDVARAKAFYGQLLSLSEVPRPESFDFPGAWYQLSNLVLHLVARQQEDPPGRRHFALWVKDVHEVAAELQKAGYPVRWDTRYKIPGVDRFFTDDPDGNRLEFQGSD